MWSVKSVGSDGSAQRLIPEMNTHAPKTNARCEKLLANRFIVPQEIQVAALPGIIYRDGVQSRDSIAPRSGRAHCGTGVPLKSLPPSFSITLAELMAGECDRNAYPAAVERPIPA